METSGDLDVRGRCDGELQVDGTVTIAEGAICHAVIRARRALVRGEVLGAVMATEFVQIAAGGRVVGDVRAPEVAVDAEAEVTGSVDLLAPAPQSLPLERLELRVRGAGAKRPRLPRPQRPSIAPS